MRTDKVSSGWGVGACVDVAAYTPDVPARNSSAVVVGVTVELAGEFLRYAGYIFGFSAVLIGFGYLASVVLP